MQVTAQLDFHDFEPTEQQRELIEQKIAGLVEFFGRITACRVVMKGPGHRHRTGGLYEVNIHLVLPDGREVAVERTPDEDERFADPAFAINDAFNRIRRRLQDEARHLRGDVKSHAPQPTATVREVRPEEGYGFLQTEDGREIYFHQNSVLDSAFGRLKPGERVTFVEEEGDKGPQASTVKILGKHGMR